MITFLAFFVELVGCTESVQQRNFLFATKRYIFHPCFVATQLFLCFTDSVRQSNSKKLEEKKHGKKLDMVKMENHSNKNISFVYLIGVYQTSLADL